MINQKEGETELKVKVHYDNMVSGEKFLIASVREKKVIS